MSELIYNNMKNLLAFVALITFYQVSAFSQATPKPQEKPGKQAYTYVDETPVPPGGQEGLIKFLKHNLKYPNKAIKANAEGTVYVSLVVKADGRVSEVHVQRDNVGYGCGKEAVRVVKKMKKWTPGKIQGKEVSVQYVLPVKFVLH